MTEHVGWSSGAVSDWYLAGGILYTFNPRHTLYHTRGILPSSRRIMIFYLNITHYLSLHIRTLMHRHTLLQTTSDWIQPILQQVNSDCTEDISLSRGTSPPPHNTFTAIVDRSRFNNSCLKLPASTLVDLIFHSRSFSLNQLTCHCRRETCTAASVYLADVIFIPFIVYYAYIVI